MNLFYAPGLVGDLHTLNEEESRHCVKVLRLKTGDVIHITDGKGNLWESVIEDNNPRECTIRLIKNQKPETRNPEPETRNPELKYGFRPYRLHIAIAPMKNIDRFEWFLEKATEIGIDEITPLICDNSERRHIRTDRLVKVITAAMKQSIKAWHPVLNEPETFNAFLKKDSGNLCKLIAYIDDVSPMLSQAYEKERDAIILIGPEGDFSEDEVRKAKEAGYQTVSLGFSRLRTETAGLAACHTVYLKNFGE
ncbi:MAG: 16S rRNA (uracil(1498)-N(3))-methyltransferase [Bacteroidales bacterium]|nr:16S rRNA (uracil(1498)-N(3))-methyltransferase [Bacteroidales bacterium]